MALFSNTPLAADSLKGGAFFGSSLIPNSLFSNIPNTIVYQDIIPGTNSQQPQKVLELSLQKLKEQLEYELQAGVDDNVFKNFLLQTTVLLIDYRDLRNFVFFGSAETEIKYNIKYLIENYPFSAYIAGTNTNVLEVNSLSNNITEIIFDSTQVIKNTVFEFTDDEKVNWLDFDIVDENNNTYQIIDYEAGIYTPIQNIVFTSNTTTLLFAAAHGFTNGEKVRIKSCNVLDLNAIWYVQVTSPTELVLYNDSDLTDPVIKTGVVFTEGRIRENVFNYLVPYQVRILVNGVVSLNTAITYEEASIIYSGFVLSKNASNKVSFYSGLTPLQNHIISLGNRTPWPRQEVTNNLIIDGVLFDQWIENPNTFQQNYSGNEDEFGYYSNLSAELNIVAATTMDEEYTNQLIRRGVPHLLIGELTDADDAFKRLILIAGWFFDQQKLFIDHLKYSKHINYSAYNQLSYNFYKLYAEHHGFDLFDDDNLDLAALVVKTEPGLSFNLQGQGEFTDLNNSTTLYLLQKEKQKRLLKNLLYLYKTKGTQISLSTLINLLGIPEGLISLKEFAFQVNNLDAYGYPLSYAGQGTYSGRKIVDNNKIHVPQQIYEIDPTKLVNPLNINDPVNLPYCYVLRLLNAETHNLRELDLITDPQGSIIQDILNYGIQPNNYVRITPGSFLNLQNKTDDYYLLPLTFPDKYCGVYCKYNIPRGGLLKKTIGEQAVLRDQVFDIASLYQTSTITYTDNTPDIIPGGIGFNYHRDRIPLQYLQQGSFDLESGNPGDAIEIIINGVTILNTVYLQDVFSTCYAIANKINTLATTPNYFATVSNNTIIIYNEALDFNISGLNPVINTVCSISNIVPFSSTHGFIPNSYIQCKLENQALVIRLRLSSEITLGISQERIAIYEDFFVDDGLDHSLRLVYRDKGVEVYRDLILTRVIPWLDPLTATNAPYLAYEVPLNEFSSCTELPLDIIDLAEISANTGDDLPRYWDLFVGLPTNILFDISELQVFEAREVNHSNTLVLGVFENNYESEVYHFTVDIENNVLTPVFKTTVPEGDELNDHHLPLGLDNLVLNMSLNPYQPFSNCVFESKQQDFFIGINDFDIDQILSAKAWEQDLHKVYQYNILQNLIQNYLTFSPQILSYENLIPFINLIEQKFSVLTKQFVPIVINTSDFIKRIAPENPAKVHYPVINKICTPTITGLSAQGKFKLVRGDAGTTLSLNIPGIPAITVDWFTSTFVTLQILKQQVEAVYSGGEIQIQLNSRLSCTVLIDVTWYEGQTSNDINTIVFAPSITAGPGELQSVIGFLGGVSESIGTCGFSFVYSLPVRNTCKQPYIYDYLETGEKIYVYDESEPPVNTPLEYIYDKGEITC